MEATSNRLLCAFAWISGALVLLTTALLIGFLIQRGLGSINGALFFGDTPWLSAVLNKRMVFDGIWPALAGTFLLVVLSSSLAIPVGIASGLYLAEYAPKRVRSALEFAVDLLSGTPSIVMGLFGFALILLLRKTIGPNAQTGLWLAGLCLALLILPYVIRTTQTALEALPPRFRMVGPAMGLSRWQNVRKVLLPMASRGIFSGAILAIGRAAEDTAVILLTGVVAQTGLPRGLGDKFEALPFRIYFLAAEYRSQHQLDQGFAMALVLMAMTGALFLAAFALRRSAERRWKRQ